MRGSDLNLAIYNSNFFIRKCIIVFSLLFNIVMIMLLYFNKRYDILKYGMTTINEIATISNIFLLSSPTIQKNGNIDELIDPGKALFNEGGASVLFDCLVLCMLVKMLIFYSYWWCTLYLLIFVSMFYKLDKSASID
ncbi:hypothetical protein AAJ76_262000931 [Vairimorpha ceranae]|uniref:Uncharacterized protein n=1 Tax=Vairimorpha ceranae TaxID=40302 RepID=A0A0F9W7G1_9MICR|nr:hypothetical protein AAJ76_262000931 [Vairimorpha ceranae]KAF5139790.1 hypothetical protein G9O61_00g020510 [Vairimorpha ceranae]KKO73741.1 hypothetical protein AAJ76_262000931 [Vairimorpha ceranae]